MNFSCQLFLCLITGEAVDTVAEDELADVSVLVGRYYICIFQLFCFTPMHFSRLPSSWFALIVIKSPLDPLKFLVPTFSAGLALLYIQMILNFFLIDIAFIRGRAYLSGFYFGFLFRVYGFNGLSVMQARTVL